MTAFNKLEYNVPLGCLFPGDQTWQVSNSQRKIIKTSEGGSPLPAMLSFRKDGADALDEAQNKCNGCQKCFPQITPAEVCRKQIVIVTPSLGIPDKS